MSARMNQKPLDRTTCIPIFVHVAMAVARSYCGGVAICYVLPVFRDHVMLSYHGVNGRAASDKIRLQGRFTSSTLPKPPIPRVFGRVRHNRHRGRSRLSTTDLFTACKLLGYTLHAVNYLY